MEQNTMVEKGKKYKYHIPPTPQLLELALFVGLFSVANGIIIDAIQKKNK